MPPSSVLEAIGAVTLGLDLTLRDLQNDLKAKGQPWERAKAFDGACILADWVEADEIGDLQELELVLMINGVERQHGFSQDMIFDIGALLVEINQSFSLEAGDVLVDGHVGVQSVALEDHGDVAVLRGNVVDEAAADVHLALGDFLQTGDHAQGSGLTTARGADEDDEFLVLDLQVEIGDGRSRSTGVDLVDMLAADRSHKAFSSIDVVALKGSA
jgi:2-keto-4-pentenoate hydratase/2-oxohepta-3-ene-1,7-dioic acid hydratase in catechol pathway